MGIIRGVERIRVRNPFRDFNIPLFEELISTGKTSPPGELDPLGRRVTFGYRPGLPTDPEIPGFAPPPIPH